MKKIKLKKILIFVLFRNIMLICVFIFNKNLLIKNLKILLK